MFAPVRPKPRVHESFSSGAQCVTFGRAAAGAKTMVYPPTNFKGTSQKLGHKLEREFVHGINTSIPLQHIQGDVIFAAGCLVIVQDLETKAQRYFEGHNNDVSALAVTSKTTWVASGQLDPKGPGGPYVCVWSPRFPEHPIAELRYYVSRPDTKASISDRIAASRGHICIYGDCCVKECTGARGGIPRRDVPNIPGQNQTEEEFPLRGITAVAFSPNANVCAFFAADDNNSCLVYQIAELRSSHAPPLETVVFRHPTCIVLSGKDAMMCMMPNMGDADVFRFASTGLGVFKMWEYSKNNELKSNLGIFGSFRKPRGLLGLTYAPDPAKCWIVGDNGYFFTVHGSKVNDAKKLASSLGCVGRIGSRFLCGAADACILIGEINAHGTPIVQQTVRLSESNIPATRDFVLTASKSVRFNAVVTLEDGALLTTSSPLAMLQLHSVAGRAKQPPVVEVLTVAHGGEVHGIACHPTIDGLIVTGGTARDIRFWNVEERRALVGKVMREQWPVYALDFSPHGDLLAVGMDMSVLKVYSFPALQIVFDRRISVAKTNELERISWVTFAPDGELLGAACWDSYVYLLKVVQKGAGADIQPFKTLVGNSAAPTHIMFSADSHYVVSNSKDAQILCWRKSGERELSPAMFRDTEWASWSCILGWPVIGVWDRKYDITDINAVAQTEGYIVSGDDEGHIRLFRFPAPYKDQIYKEYGGHGSHVTNVRWGKHRILVSLGGDDHSVVQWRLKKDREEHSAPQPVHYAWTQVEPVGDGIEAQLGRIVDVPVPHLPPQTSANVAETDMPKTSPSEGKFAKNNAPSRLSKDTPATMRCKRIARQPNR
eukprot:GEMP01015050.1.p1 GENE.GEMP01015050.1~~GEMP01015050.1.p1  ORF type:complete len:830 (+),score=221.85 GEMP01015050.1:65-2554(+)